MNRAAIALMDIVSLHLAPSEQFHEARFVRITDGRLPIGLDPFGMLESQVVVNLLTKLTV